MVQCNHGQRKIALIWILAPALLSLVAQDKLISLCLIFHICNMKIVKITQRVNVKIEWVNMYKSAPQSKVWYLDMNSMCLGFPPGASDKEPPANAGDMRCRFHPWDGEIPWRREWQPTPVFLPGESHGWGAWRATVHEFAQLHPVQTWLKQLSRHACMLCVYCHYYHEPLGKGVKANMIDNGAEDSLSNRKYNTTWIIDQAWIIMTWLMWSMSWFQECDMDCARHFALTVTFYAPSTPMWWVLLLFLLYKRRNWSSERLSSLVSVTQSVVQLEFVLRASWIRNLESLQFSTWAVYWKTMWSFKNAFKIHL